MIYLNAFYVVEMQLLKSGPSREKVVRGGGNGENGVKSLAQNPHIYTTYMIFHVFWFLSNEFSRLKYIFNSFGGGGGGGGRKGDLFG